MKVFAISDLHLSINNPKPMDIFGGAWDNYLEAIDISWKNNVSENDIVLIAGDISWAITLDNAKPDLEYIGNYPGKKVMIRGNHDYWWKSITNIRNILMPDSYAVQNDCIRINDYLICGSRGWATPAGEAMTEEDKKIYARELIRTELSLIDMQSKRKETDKVISLIHYPPFNVKFAESGFTALYSKYNVDAVIYGHLHGKDVRAELYREIGSVKYYLTSCDLVKNELVRIF